MPHESPKAIRNYEAGIRPANVLATCWFASNIETLVQPVVVDPRMGYHQRVMDSIQVP